MDRKRLEIDLAYAERDRLLAVGRVVMADTVRFVSASNSGKVLPLEAVDRPRWLSDGCRITDGTETCTVLIGSDRVCLLVRDGAAEPTPTDTSVLVANWRPAEA